MAWIVLNPIRNLNSYTFPFDLFLHFLIDLMFKDTRVEYYKATKGENLNDNLNVYTIQAFFFQI